MEKRKKPHNKKNLATERGGLGFLLRQNKAFHVPSLEEKRHVLSLLGQDLKYTRSFDVLRLKVSSFERIRGKNDFELIEVKVTRKKLAEFPKGFFFGFTENEDRLLKKLQPRFKLCLVSLGGRGQYCLLTHRQLHKLIKHKRVQYQINL